MHCIWSAPPILSSNPPPALPNQSPTTITGFASILRGILSEWNVGKTKELGNELCYFFTSSLLQWAAAQLESMHTIG